MLVAAGEDHVRGVHRAVGGLQAPAPAVALDALDLHAEADVEPVVLRVGVEVADDVITRRERARPGRIRRAVRELRVPAGRVHRSRS